MIRSHAIAALVMVSITAAAPMPALAKKKRPPAEAPAPPPTPMRPIPPNGAVLTMPIPPIDATGVRQTVNINLTPAQKIWNLRSALNVAALNCLEPRHAPILEAYKLLLKKHAKTLAATSRAVDDEFRKKYGTSYQTQRDMYNTQVYNYFALPPARAAFCDAALTISDDMLQASALDINLFAAQSIPRVEQAFDAFYRAFEQFRVDAAAWDAKYGQYFGYTLSPGTTLTPAGAAPASGPAAAMGTPMLAVPQPSAPASQPPAVPTGPVAPAAAPLGVPVTASGNPPPGG